MKIFDLDDKNSPLIEQRTFPDGESYLRIKTSVEGERVVVWCTLNNPDAKLIRLIFLAQTLKENGAIHITLVAPYLCYLRQDAVFQKGDCFSAKYLGQLLSQYFDHIITVAPHLHRIHDLSEIFSIKTTVVSPKLAIVDYIKAHISDPFLIVPDENMAEWAKELSCPYRIVKKIRHSDREVTIEPLINLNLENRNVVVVDDIVSSGTTLENIYKALPVRPERPFTIIIHAIFSEIIYRGLNLLYQKVITTNTTPSSE